MTSMEIDADAIIEVHHVGKRYRLKPRGGRTLKAAVVEWLRGSRGGREFWALQDVTFLVRKGQTLGIIGPNGAGKSTLLALISGTSRPTTGRIVRRGSVSSLLELGAGFHPDLSGRENVFLYGAIMGLTRRQMAARLNAVMDFAGLRDWIDEPVKHYSSGMYVRLAFSVAVEVDPDILIIDEVFAVGDAAFQRKCLQRIADFKRRGKTLIIVSHDLHTIRAISDEILLLDSGRLVAWGPPDQVVTEYQWRSRERDGTAAEREWGNREVEITGVELLDEQGVSTATFRWNGSLEARIAYRAHRRVSDPVFGFAIHAANGTLIYGNNTQIEGYEIPDLEGDGVISLRLDHIALPTGAYLLSFSVHSADHRTNYHRLDHRYRIEVQSEKNFEGCTYMPVRWELQRQ